ncbi:TRPM8 channel-associated factor homolog [Mixophyes fleayi]|uniref:TRPM8 channel-associated factor homolog n=1 Tax=Mixophyes fleayi TaxID=3061075 RepID=UPI003F4E4547
MNPVESYKALVKNIDSLNFTDHAVPCDLLLSGDSAFPVLVNPKGQVLIAASQYGKGRIVVMAHEGYLTSPHFTQFIDNAIEWLKPSADSLVGIHKKFPTMAQSLSDKGHEVESNLDFNNRFGVYCTHAYEERQSSELITALKEGMGLLVGGQAWYWITKNKLKNVVLDYPGNKVTSVAGIHFLSNYGQKGIYNLTPEIPISSLMAEYKWDISEDIKQLLNGITELHLLESGSPSHLLVHGQRAFPLALDESHKTYLAAAYYGKGRVVVATHEDQISQPCQKQLINNLISWLDAGRKGKIGLHRELNGLQDCLEEGVTSQQSEFNQSFSVYCCTTYTDNDAQNILEFVANGGGLLIGGQAWYWASQNPGIDALTDYPGNKIINQFGISMLSDEVHPGNLKTVDIEDPSRSYHLRKALHQLKKLMDGNKEIPGPLSSWMMKLSEDCAALLAVKYQDKQAFYPFKDILISALLKHGLPNVSPSQTIKGGSKDSFLLRVAAGIYNTSPNFETTVEKLFPEMTSLPASPQQILEINCTNKGHPAWRSTGLYVPPGKTATVIFPTSAINVGLQVQIGSHSDNLTYLSELKRPPVVVQRYAVDKVTLPVSSIFGGLIYIIIPEERDLGNIQISIEDAVLAPYFKNGETSDSSWVETIRHFPSPWAELETKNIIFTFPSNLVRSLEKPSKILTVWDRMMEEILKLSALPPVFERQERIVVDTQLLEGWMHSGYPIMCHVKSVEALLNVEDITQDMWGAIHELGHNQQFMEWEFPPHTNEALCNLWAIYVYENVFEILREKAHSELQPKMREDRIIQYLEDGTSLDNWSGWVCLETYLQLQEGFGWDPYIKLFSDYKKLTDIRNENRFKMNLWAELFSQQVQKNLVPFFKTWGWPIEEELAERLSTLPEWDENPMKKYIL